MESSKASWDNNAEVWAQRIRAGGDIHRRLLINPLILNIAKSLKPGLVLDVGAGEASFSAEISKYLNAKVIAADFSFSMCRQAKDYSSEKLAIINADVHRLPFKRAIFDLVIANMLVQGIPDLDECFSSLARVLKARGAFIFSTLNSSRVMPYADNMEGSLISIDGKNNLPSIVPVTEYKKKRIILAPIRLGNKDRIPSKVYYYHRMLSDYSISLKRSGFVTDVIYEPMPNDELVYSYPEMSEFWDSAPFLVWVCRKTRPSDVLL